MNETPAKKSDLPVRTASAVVMLAVAGTALWLGGWWWTAFVAAVALGVLWEWWGLVGQFAPGRTSRALWLASGLIYVAIASATLVFVRDDIAGLLMVLLGVIFTDIGAYFAGRTIGGPKIAPSISPSKTWAGLVGGAVCAGLVLALFAWAWPTVLCELVIGRPEAGPGEGRFMFDSRCSLGVPPISYLARQSILAGALIAIIAQAGDFFESWMKRRAGVKDSGKLIPGHGGLFDRVDGLLAVLFVMGIATLATRGVG